jgi:exopolysaccharide biosynthesis polyprenyl glycosylphosphotransferase
VVGRGVAYGVVRTLRSRRIIGHRTALIGDGPAASHLAAVLTEHPELGLDPVGYIDLPSGGVADTIRAVDAQVVVVYVASIPKDEVIDVIRECDRLSCEIFVVPVLHELFVANSRDIDSIWGTPVVRLNRAAHRSLRWHTKRLVDIVAAAFGLVLLSPVLAACAAATRIEGGPGVIFRQERVGLDGRHFEILKFRTMPPADDTESETRWSIADDDRVGPVGSVLRRTSLDELPQLWNVLVGDMSMVGPRPERPHFVDTFAKTVPDYQSRHRVPSGLTGWAQVHGLRGDTDLGDRARFDNSYIESWSIWNDVKILLRTVWSVIFLRGR